MHAGVLVSLHKMSNGCIRKHEYVEKGRMWCASIPVTGSIPIDSRFFQQKSTTHW